MYDIQEAHQFNRQADKTKISVKNRQISPYKNQSFVSDVNKINDLQEDLNTSSVIECNHDTDLHKFYAERKRQAEEDNVKEITEFENKYDKKIDGYPTILLVYKDQVVEFDTEITQNNLVDFFNTVF